VRLAKLNVVCALDLSLANTSFNFEKRWISIKNLVIKVMFVRNGRVTANGLVLAYVAVSKPKNFIPEQK